MRILIFALFVIFVASLTVEINNIHYGFRNIYVGEAQLKQNNLLISSYHTLKNEVAAEDTPFLKVQSNAVVIDFTQLVRSYYVDEINPQQPQLMFRFFDQPSIIITIFSEQKQQNQIGLLNRAAQLGKDISELDL